MPFFQKFSRILLLFVRGPHPFLRVFNRILINNLEDERRKVVPDLKIANKLNYQNKFLLWTY